MSDLGFSLRWLRLLSCGMPCSPPCVNRSFGGTCHLQFQDRRISKLSRSAYWLLLTWFSIRPWRWRCFFKIPVNFHSTTRRYIPEDRNLATFHCSPCSIAFYSHVHSKHERTLGYVTKQSISIWWPIYMFTTTPPPLPNTKSCFCNALSPSVGIRVLLAQRLDRCYSRLVFKSSLITNRL